MKWLLAVFIWVLLLSCCPLFFSNSIALADGLGIDDSGSQIPDYALNSAAAENDVVSDWAAMNLWLFEHRYVGGTVYLGDNIEITDSYYYMSVASSADTSIVIETGPYGFIVSGSLSIGSSITVAGYGSPNPVIRVCDGGELYLHASLYEYAQTIIATGVGGVCLKLESGAAYKHNLSNVVRYQALGANSIAIESAIKLDLREHYIIATGSGSRGIVSDEPVSLFLSHVISETAAISAPVVELDTCIISPEIEKARIISRKISDIAPISGVQEPISLGRFPDGFYSLNDMLSVITLSADGVRDEYITVALTFDDSSVDYSKPGIYHMPVVLPLPSPYDSFNLIPDGTPLMFSIEFFDPSIPFFVEISKWGIYIIWHTYSGDEDLTLWRSDDDGESWFVFWKQGDEPDPGFEVILDPPDFLNIVIYDPSVIPEPAWFVYEVGAGKGSEIFHVDLGKLIVGIGGDRDGGDRILRPWEAFSGVADGGEDKQKSSQGSSRNRAKAADLSDTSSPDEGNLTDTADNNGTDIDEIFPADVIPLPNEVPYSEHSVVSGSGKTAVSPEQEPHIPVSVLISSATVDRVDRSKKTRQNDNLILEPELPLLPEQDNTESPHTVSDTDVTASIPSIDSTEPNSVHQANSIHEPYTPHPMDIVITSQPVGNYNSDVKSIIILVLAGLVCVCGGASLVYVFRRRNLRK
jgi:hypothetical protein